MQEPELFLVFLRPLNNTGIPYMVTGSTAAMIYGEPRMTHDIDLVVDLKAGNVEAFHEVFNTQKYYVPPLEVLHIEAARKIGGHFNLLYQDTGFKADIYLKGEDELHAWAFEKRSIEIINEYKIQLAPPEYVIIRKLMYYEEGRSDKHLSDIRNILTNIENNIDYKVIERLTNKLGVSEIWSQFN